MRSLAVQNHTIIRERTNAPDKCSMRTISFSPRHLKPFVAVAHAGSVARAAEVVSRVQSAITRSIKDLEADLCVALFERRPHGMVLTDYGAALLPYAEAAFSEMNEAREALDQILVGQRWNANAPVFSLGLGRQRLLVFAEVLRQRHAGAVAKQFGLTQSAVSLALREMEQGLGVALVSRSGVGISANAAGERLALHVRRAFAQLAQAEEEIALLREGVGGHVVVGTLSLARSWLLPQAILRVTREHPGIRISTIEGSFEHLASLLRAGEVDFLLGGVRAPADLTGLDAIPVLSSTIVFLARAGHALEAAIQQKGAEALEAARWVAPPRGTWTRSALDAALDDMRLKPGNVVVETADSVITRALVMDGEMITAASPELFRREIAAGELMVLSAAPQAAPRDIGIVTRSGGRASVTAKLLMESVLSFQRDAD